MKIKLRHSFEDIISIENILEAWEEFVKGKRHRRDVQKFSLRLADNILSLHDDLGKHIYRHGGYQAFNIFDPKLRNIHKASVRDRLLHHALYRILYPFFNRTFMADSFSCRLGKGTHKAVNRLRSFASIVSRNHTRTCWVLKCDIKKFFASFVHKALLNIFQEYIPDKNILWLLEKIISSFSTTPGVGLPLGNLTSQLLVNIYMNKFDQFIKHILKAKYYIRYADDFVLLSENRDWLEKQIPFIRDFLQRRLKLTLHPRKISIETVVSGIDFLGYVVLPHHKVLRTKTKRRMFKRMKLKKQEIEEGLIDQESFDQSLQSYLGILKHCKGYKIEQKLCRIIKDS